MVTRMAPREDAGTEGTRLSVLSDWLGARSLALVPPGETVLVAEVGIESTEQRYQASGLSRGVVALCEENDGGRVTIQLATGPKLTLPPEDAWFVWVTAPPRGTAINRTGATPSTRK
jgi:hypothetical protein